MVALLLKDSGPERLCTCNVPPSKAKLPVPIEDELVTATVLPMPTLVPPE